jgi:hypothetical protein
MALDHHAGIKCGFSLMVNKDTIEHFLVDVGDDYEFDYQFGREFNVPKASSP